MIQCLVMMTKLSNASFTLTHFYCTFSDSVNKHFLTHFPCLDICAKKLTCQLVHSEMHQCKFMMQKIYAVHLHMQIKCVEIDTESV